MVRLAPQPAKVLKLLVERAGSLVSREEIQRALWQDETYVDFDQGLNYCVRQIRIALEESADQPRFIATLPKRGYRFTVEVEWERPKSAEVAAPAELVREPVPAADERSADVPVIAPSEDEKRQDASLHPGIGPGNRPGIGPRLHTSLRWALAGAAVAVLAVGGLYIFRAKRQPGASPLRSAETSSVPARPSVAVLGFTNLAGKDRDAWLGTALSEMYATELSAGGRLRLVSGEEVAKARTQTQLPHSLSQETLGRLRMELGADLFVLGSYTMIDHEGSNKLRVDLRLQDARDGQIVASISETGDERDVFELVAASGLKLRQRLGAGSLSQTEQNSIDDSFPSNPNARRLYAEGLNKLRRYDALGARQDFEQATVIEPKFVAARSALAAAWSSLGYDAKATEEAKKAFDLAAGLPREQQLSTEARYYEMSQNRLKAIETLGTLTAYFADDLDYGIRLATVQFLADKSSDALNTVARLRKLPEPLRSNARLDLLEAQIHAHDGDFKLAQARAEDAVRKGQSEGAQLLVAQGLLLKASALERLGSPDESLAASSEAKVINTEASYPKGVGLALMIGGDALNGKGDFNGARERYENALSFFREIGDKKNMGLTLERIGNTYHDQGRFAESGNDYTRALEIYREIDWQYGVASAMGNLANALDAFGDLQGSLKMHQAALKVFQATGQKRGTASEMDNTATVQMELGDLAGATATYQATLALHRQIGYRHGEMYALSGIGDVLLLQNDLEGARKNYEAARKLAEATKEENDVARMDVSLAEVLFYEKRFAEAEARVRGTIARFEKDQDSEDLASAYALLARILLAEHRQGDAMAAGRQALGYSEKITALPQQFEVALTLARLDLAGGRGESAKGRIETVLERARKGGYVQYTLEGRGLQLTLNAERGRKSQQAALVSEAKRKGFELMAAEITGMPTSPGAHLEGVSASLQ